MIDHVGVRFPRLDVPRRLYARPFELLDGRALGGRGISEWEDLAIGEETEERPVTRRLHIGFRAVNGSRRRLVARAH